MNSKSEENLYQIGIDIFSGTPKITFQLNKQLVE